MRLSKLTLLAMAVPALLGTAMSGCTDKNVAPDIATVEANFKAVPDSTRIAVYWYWLNDHISSEGVVKDLQSMKEAGIGRAYIGFQGIEDIPYGDVHLFTDEWWRAVHTALKTAGDLDIEIGIFNCPGWSQSGGPWVKPEQAMRYLASKQVEVTGAGAQTIALPEMGEDAQDVCVIAYPAPAADGFSQEWTFEKQEGKPLQAVMRLPQPTVVRSMAVTVSSPIMAAASVKVKDGDEWKLVKTFEIDRYNPNLHVGFDPYAPIIVSLPENKVGECMLEVGNAGSGTINVVVNEYPMVERYAEKSLAKMFQQPLPMWDQYMWAAQPESTSTDGIVDPASVVDLTASVQPDGTLQWNVPDGRWIVSRLAMRPTGVTNSPAAPDATGFEVDKMNKDHLEAHFDAFIGEIMRRVPAEDRKTFKIIVEDSYETGGQNWTDALAADFEERYGYSPVPYLPVLRGIVVGSEDQSDRFLWDLRRLIADKVAYDYVGGLREISNRNGFTTWLENYGHWGFPAEFLQYGGQSDEIGGEFWSEGSLGDIENRAASSCGHIYGKNKIWAESCTSGGPVFTRYPAIMKQRVDRFFTEGINATLLHLYTHQDSSAVEPGIAAWFGNEFNRKNIWFPQMRTFTDYLRRCNYMLQQGRYVADVAYFIGEDAPKMTGVCDPELPAGYSFDYINGEILAGHAKVKDGRLLLDSGMEYRLLVLPRQESMRPELLEKIKSLVADGLTILGPAPTCSPSLQNYPEADNKVKAIAAEMWGDAAAPIDSKDCRGHKFGKGRVYSGCDIVSVLGGIGVGPDLLVPAGEEYPLFIHRTMADAEIYFVANPYEKELAINPAFRVDGVMYPELWNPVDGEVRNLSEFKVESGTITVPLQLQPLESVFVVFRKGESPVAGGVNNPVASATMDLTAPWTVTFDASRRGPKDPVVMESLADWTTFNNDSIKYYSGSAVYSTTFDLEAVPSAPTYLDLGKVMVMARVKVNGHDAGGVWTAPYRVDVTPYLQQGENTVEVEVVNNWKNRMIGDDALPEDQRQIWTNVWIHHKGDELQPSGLMGPVRLQSYDYHVKN